MKTLDNPPGVADIVAEIGVVFPTVGGGVPANPLDIKETASGPLQFAPGVNVSDVVRFILDRNRLMEAWRDGYRVRDRECRVVIEAADRLAQTMLHSDQRALILALHDLSEPPSE